MKKFSILLLAATLFAACSRPISPVEKVADGYPIIPVRLVGDTTEVFLTDYVPSLAGVVVEGSDIVWNVDEGLTVEEIRTSDEYTTLPESFLLTSDEPAIHFLHITDADHSIDIPVLPALPVEHALISTGADAHSVSFRLLTPVSSPQFYALLQNRLLPAEAWTIGEDGSYTLALPAAPKGRSLLRVYAEAEGRIFNDILIPLENGEPVQSVSKLTRHDDQAQVLYSLMIDRFENGNTANDRKLNDPEVLDVVDYQGGDFQGITNKINEGWFDSLGITTIWISPITQNPWTSWGCYPFKEIAPGVYNNKFDSTRAYTKFSGYHGYWPIYITVLEQRFGTDREFRAMLDAAHRHNLNVVLDYVANHMHIESPTFRTHPDWHTDSILPDGRRNFELWDEARLTTWFDKHIPTLDLERPEVCQPLTDSALFWLENYDLDGFRHDACKHIPLNYWRMLGQKMAQRFPGRHIWMIGETYGDAELIGSYVKSGMLPAQFDFNIYHTAIDILGKENGSMKKMAAAIEESLAAYGAHHTMGNISGNHDKCRFISLAGGAVSWSENDKEAGWTRYCGVTPDDSDPANAERMEEAYRKAMLLEVINLTIPGVPCIYQGDEFGAAGANDPDNRGMMRFAGLSEREQQFRHEMEQLIALRRSSMPLLYGDYIPVSCDDNVLVFDRVYLGETVRVTIDMKNLKYSIE